MHQTVDLIVPADGNENTLVSTGSARTQLTAPIIREHEHKLVSFDCRRLPSLKTFGTKYARLAI